ncbi:MAG: hypothetical protein GC185_01700 [Alphaproteobacteria bacterium]|nr:hypothetical protein [Alphaproteobacteria bacterium]
MAVDKLDGEIAHPYWQIVRKAALTEGQASEALREIIASPACPQIIEKIALQGLGEGESA